ncbi:hypothetical protein CALVIDRAFT_149409 [Calocera viscosa TUFC12733]|uniref:Zn(2)-C6 fungal-type domain-containing protein n=1 Tax=Calocera viscosa (strain TUFC12733) TaxID=1330018 RepID=A0A167LHS1_CALVF|nr:hypothetical protein CALVIDRAFT_149409 [Calocera viscosa TUFC12733]
MLNYFGAGRLQQQEGTSSGIMQNMPGMADASPTRSVQTPSKASNAPPNPASSPSSAGRNRNPSRSSNNGNPNTVSPALQQAQPQPHQSSSLSPVTNLNAGAYAPFVPSVAQPQQPPFPYFANNGHPGPHDPSGQQESTQDGDSSSAHSRQASGTSANAAGVGTSNPAIPQMITPAYSYAVPTIPFYGNAMAGATPMVPMYPAMPHYIPPPNPSQPPSEKSKRNQVKNACTNCQRACKKCDDCRPCVRCVKYGIGNQCSDSQRKERKKGVKRGPYKKRDGKSAQHSPVLSTKSTHVAPVSDTGYNAVGHTVTTPESSIMHGGVAYYAAGYAGFAG